MTRDRLRQAKIVLGCVWVVCLAAFVVPMGALGGILRLVFWLTLVAHVVEFVVFRRRLLEAGGTVREHLVLTLVFGMLHVQSVTRADDRA